MVKQTLNERRRLKYQFLVSGRLQKYYGARIGAHKTDTATVLDLVLLNTKKFERAKSLECRNKD